jgi:uncharacterized protein (TIGR02099 family)
MHRRLRWMLDAALVAGAALLALAALGQLALRAALPRLPAESPRIEAAATRALGHRLAYARIEARMAGFTPAIRLRDVVLTGADGSETRLERLQLRVALLRSLWNRELRFAEVTGRGLVLDARRDVHGRWWLGGIPLGEQARPGMLDWLLEWPRARLDGGRIEVHDARSGTRVTVRASEVLMRRGLGGRRLSGRLVLSGDVRGAVRAVAQVEGLRRDVRTARWALELRVEKAWLAAFTRTLGAADAQYEGALYLRGEGARIARASGTIRAHGRLDGDPPDAVRSADAAGVWQRRAGGWILGLDRVEVGGTDDAFARGVLIGREGARVRARIARAKLPDDAVLWAALGRLPRAPSLPMPLVPALQASDIAVVLDGGARAVSAHLDALAWAADDGLPGVQGIAGPLRARDERASLVLEAGALAVDLPRLYREPLRLDAPEGRAVLHRDAGVWALTVPELRAAVREIPVAAALQMRFARERTVALALALGDVPAPRAAVLLPDRALHPHVVEWYRDAVQGGVLQGSRLLLYGPPGRLFDPGAPARLLAQARFAQVGLDYLPGSSWPALRNLSGTLGVDGRTLTVEGSGATQWDTQLVSARATIPDFRASKKTLAVEAELSGDAAELLRLARETPMRKVAANGLDALAISGAARTALALDVALTGSKNIAARGRTTLADARFEAPGVDVQALAGTVVLEGEKLRAEGLTGRFLEGDAEFSLAAQAGGKLRVDARGSGDATALARRAGLAAHVHGPASWSATLERGAGTTTVDAVLDLDAATLDLPAPLGKPAGTPGQLRGRARCCAPAGVWRLDADLPGPGIVRLELEPVADGGAVLKRGELAVGLAPQLPEHGLRVRADTARIEADAWLAWFTRARPVPAGGALLSGIDARAKALVLAGRTLANQRVSITPGAPWQLAFEGPQLAGSATFDPSAGGKLDLTLERLHWPDPPPDAGETATSRSGLDPRRFPVVNARIAELRLGGRALGRLELDSERVPDGLRARSLVLSAPFATAKGTGEWTGAGADAQTRLSGSLRASDIGQLLRAAGLGVTVERGQGELRGELQWPGAPSGFVLARTRGDVRVRLSDATLPDIEPGLGRLLGVLSLETLQRRLLLDFRDVFGRGFVVDDLRGRLALEPGAVRTDALRVRGPAAHLTLRGALYLPEGALDLDVNVIPQLTSSLPAAVAIGSLGIGAAVLIGQRLFGDAINEITAQDYRVTGTLEAPQVMRVPAP